MGTGGTYRERVLDGEIAERLSAIGAVLIEGPRGLREDRVCDPEGSYYLPTRRRHGGPERSQRRP